MLRIQFTLVLLVLSSCVLGDEERTVSPYENAYFEMAEGYVVADGLSPVLVRVYGDYGATLTIRVSSTAHFLGEPANDPGETTVYLGQRDEYGFGFSEVQLVSISAGLVELSFKLAPLAATLLIDFDPVVMEIGEPRAEQLRPGVVVHQLCVYANTSRGLIESTASGGSVFPERISLQELGATGCADLGSAWVGAAMLRWTSGEREGTLESTYLGENSEQLGTAISELEGEAFPGYYAVLYDTSVSAEWASVTAQLFYESTDTLASEVAALVPLGDLTSVPQGLTLVGSSSGSADATPRTDANGMITLYFEIPETLAPLTTVFATPLGGGITLLGEI